MTSQDSFVQRFLRSKNETFEVLVIFAKRIQLKSNSKIIWTKFDHGTEFENANIEKF